MAKKSNAKRPDGLIKSKVYLGNGKYKYLYAHTQKELDAKVQEVKIQLGRGIDVSAQRDSFESWANRWLKTKSWKYLKSDIKLMRHMLADWSLYIISLYLKSECLIFRILL